MRKLLAVLIGIGMMFGAAHAQVSAPSAVADVESSIEELAGQYISLGGSEDMFLEGAAFGFREAARANGVTFNPEQRQRLRAVINQHFAEASEIFRSRLVTYYAASSTREDLTAALAFYRTPQGSQYIGACLEWTFPLSVYLASRGATTLPAPSETPPTEARLARARELAALLIAQMHPSEIVNLDGSPIGVRGVQEYIAQSFAASLDDEATAAAMTWLNTDASRRLEGPSAERTLAAQTALTLAMRSIDQASLMRDVTQILADSPT